MKKERRFLVVGLREMEAGKTTLAQALLLCLQDKGMRACGFKPKAGNILWYDYDVLYESLSQGRLYGKDAKLLKKASDTDLPEELISPVHRLWAVPPHHLKKKLATLPYFIVDRITLWEKKMKEMVVVNDALPFSYGEERLVARLRRPETSVVHVATLRQLNEITKRYYNKAIELAHKRISAEYDALVYESYADVALPWKGITGLDVILAIHPGYIQTYDPERYYSALRLSARSQHELRTSEIVNLLSPVKTIEVRPYKAEETVGRLKRKLLPFIDTVCLK